MRFCTFFFSRKRYVVFVFVYILTVYIRTNHIATYWTKVFQKYFLSSGTVLFLNNLFHRPHTNVLDNISADMVL